MADTALIVFIKNFQLRKVKTRMARTLGAEKALDIYRQLCTFTVREVQKTGLPAYLYFSEYIDHAFLESQRIDTSSGRYQFRVQTPSDLGTRMAHAFRDVLPHHASAFILGTDCPYFNASHMQQAWNILDRPDTDVVIGPANDGGYYGLGMKQGYDLFSDVDWSTDQVMPQTLSKIQNANLSHSLLPMLNDLDFEEDWNEFKRSSSAAYFQEVIRSSSSASETEVGL